MPNDDILTDDYLAELIAKDAKDCSIKYSAMGLEAYKSNKKPANAPRLNKRFLQNIIKDTSTHNAALLAREKAESEARLRALEREEERTRRRTRAGPADIRRRQIGDINAILGRKPKRSGESDDRSAKDDEEPERGSKSRRREREEESSRKSSSRKSRRRDEDDREGERRRERRRDSSRHRSRSPSRREKKYRSRSPSPRHRHSRRSRDERDGHRSERTERDRRSHRSHRSYRERSPQQRDNSDGMSESSDPLDDIIGPAPPPKSPVRARGRGTTSAYSGIDRRFSETYDPKMDVEPEEATEAGDWSEAVEVYRDRQKLRQNFETRLREAGFSDKDLVGLKDESEKSEADVKWGRRGEKRAWDIGKQDSDGEES